MNVNAKIINDMRHVSREEQEELMRIYSLMSKDKQTKLYLALFREIMMFKSMSQSFLMDYQHRIMELESRVTELEFQLTQKEEGKENE